MPKTIKKTTTTVKKTTPVKKEPVVAKKEFKICRYQDKNLKVPPRKLRLLANSIKKMSPTQAALELAFTNTSAARALSRAIKTVVSVAKNNYNLSETSLKFDTIIVGEGQKIKRMDKSHGSHFARGVIIKRHSRLLITLKGEVKS